MELRHLRSFLAVADHLSFSRAADATHITQPALSRQIRDLEHELGCRLFDRRPVGVVLTRDGARLRERVGRAVQEIDQVAREMRARSRREPRVLRLAHFGTFLALHLAPFIQRLHRDRPRWRVELVELDPAEALRRLARGEIEAAASGRPRDPLPGHWQARVIWTQAPLIVLPASHRLAKRRRLFLRDLAGEQLLPWDEERFPGFGEPFLAACRAAGFEPRVAHTVDDLAGALTAVARDGSVTYVGRLAGQLPAPGVALVPLAEGELDMPTLLIWREDAAGAPLWGELAGLLAAPAPAQARR